MLTSSTTAPPVTELPDAVDLLERTADRLRAAAGRGGVAADASARMRRLADDLSSHALAVRVLATTGASAEALDRVLHRAIDLVDGDASRSVHPDRSAS